MGCAESTPAEPSQEPTSRKVAPASAEAAPAPAAAAAPAAGAGTGDDAATESTGFIDGDDPEAEEAEEELSDSDDEGPEAKAAAMELPDAPTDLDALFTMEDSAPGDEFMAVKPWIGAVVAPSDPPETDSSKPDVELNMEYVFGYRCRGVYDNLFHAASGEVVYPAAAVGIALNKETKGQRFFRGHTDDILSLAVNKERTMVVTGGKSRINRRGRGVKPRMFVWDLETMTKQTEIEGFHKRSVNAVAWSPDSKYIASVGGDDQHHVCVHSAKSGKMLSAEKGGTDRVIGVAWHDDGFIVTVGVKHCTFWQVKNGKLQRGKKGLVGKKGKRCTQLSSTFTPKQTWTGTLAGEIYRWNGNQLKSVIKGAHKSKVSALATSTDGEFVASGGSDSKVCIWTNKGEKVREIEVNGTPRALSFGTGSSEGLLLCGTLRGEIVEIANATGDAPECTTLFSGHYDGELWGMDTNPDDENLVVTCGDDNMIAVWDMAERKQILRTVVAEKGGPKRRTRGASRSGGASTMSKYPPNQCARAVAWGSDYIAVGTNDGTVLLLNQDDLSVVATTNDVRDKQWCQVLKFSAAGDMLAVGSHDNNIYIYNTADGALELTQTCKAHNSFIASLDWTADDTALRSTCGAYELLFFATDDGTQMKSGATALKDAEWSTFTTPFGWPVQGIFPRGADGSDVNTVDTDHELGLIATGDDNGRVKLFRYPCTEEGAKAKSFAGHASHVTRVKWGADDSKLYSIGGNDNTMILWSKP